MPRELDKIINTMDHCCPTSRCLYEGVIKSDANEKKISVHRTNRYHGYKTTLGS